MPNAPSAIVQKLWNYCNILRDDGLSYGDYIEQLTYLLFLKMAHERTQPPLNQPSIIPKITSGRTSSNMRAFRSSDFTASSCRVSDESQAIAKGRSDDLALSSSFPLGILVKGEKRPWSEDWRNVRRLADGGVGSFCRARRRAASAAQPDFHAD
jgi:hypothetical protein